MSSQLLSPLFSSAAMRAIVSDRARLQRMLDFVAALARAEAAVGVIAVSAAGEIADACRAERYDLAILADAAAEAGNVAIPLINSLRAEVAKRNKSAAGAVHWGATSQDTIDTALVLELRAAIDALLSDLDRATKAFTALTGRHRRNLTVARTLLQQALPMPFGLKLAGYAAALTRSRDRLRRLRKEALVLQFGGAAGTLAALGDQGIDVSERLAALLDLPNADAPWHSHRDRLAEIASAFAIVAGTCGKIARDVALLMQTEVAEAFEPAVPGRSGSPNLPHKRNPTMAMAALSAAMQAPNLAATLLSAQLQEHERSVGGWQVEWVTFPALMLVTSGALSAVADIAEGLEVDVDRMKANLEASNGLVMAEAVSFALAGKLGRSEAHALVEELVLKAAKEKTSFKDVVAADDRVKAHLDATAIGRLFTPTSYQGAAQTFIDRLVATAQGRTVQRPRVDLLAKMPDIKSKPFPLRTVETASPRTVEAAPAVASETPPPVTASEPQPPAVTNETPLVPVEPPAAPPAPVVSVTALETPPAPPVEATPAPVVPEVASAPVIAKPPEAATEAPPAPAADAAPVVPAPAPEAPASQAPQHPVEQAQKQTEEEPSALLEIFSRVSKAADQLATAGTPGDEKKSA